MTSPTRFPFFLSFFFFFFFFFCLAFPSDVVEVCGFQFPGGPSAFHGGARRPPSPSGASLALSPSFLFVPPPTPPPTSPGGISHRSPRPNPGRSVASPARRGTLLGGSSKALQAPAQTCALAPVGVAPAANVQSLPFPFASSGSNDLNGSGSSFGPGGRAPPCSPGQKSSPVARESSPCFESPAAGAWTTSPSYRALLKHRRANVCGFVAQQLYEDMLLGRGVEEATAQLYYRGRVGGFVHLYTGQEAVSTGVLKAMRKSDVAVSTYRDHVHAVSKGVPVKEVMAELFGKQTGCCKGRGGSMHFFSRKNNFVGGFAFIGEQIPVALGFAFASAYRKFVMPQITHPKENQDHQSQQENKNKEDEGEERSNELDVVACFMGDGATNMGQFYEAINVAALAKLPIVFVVENNNWYRKTNDSR
eukprot:GHVT01001340.1.p1 GENE.GHVT01001340.1~~GHVT01001340.1.p1  ORF type:complete len:419 (+),score=101.11 GHVT01001340.1:483-1739(+)